jgi:FtsH-binding integral membrane protein
MGLFGLIIASLISMFFHVPGLGFAISVLGVLIFAGLTAYDTQQLKHSYAGCGHALCRTRGYHGRADAVSRLHQYVPVPPQLGDRR